MERRICIYIHIYINTYKHTKTFNLSLSTL
ncbi:hypothetical protein cmbei_300370 [Cryptosporidium meleagridis]